MCLVGLCDHDASLWQVSLEDMYNGTTRQLALQKSVLCPKCEGRGGKKVGCV